MTFTNAVVRQGVSRAHGTQREMAATAVPCVHDIPRQTKKIVNVIYDDFDIYSFDYVEVRCKKA